MKKLFFSICILTVAVSALVAKNQDDTVMTVNGKPVLKSEFEYLYNKNAGQQLEYQTLDEYVDMFVNYKLKVADALANGYDTTAEFKSELAGYQNELLAPYLIDKEAEKELIDLAYDHYKSLRKVAHIMFPDPTRQPGAMSVEFIDSIRGEIIAGRLSWDDAAARFSVDRQTSANGGEMGWLIPGRFPVAFEDMCYATETGTISEPVNSGFGIHLIKVEAEKPNPGEVKARHILKLTHNKSPEEAAKVKEQIDSIYNVLMGGADFADVARRESEDPGSKANGGELDWFGAGMMVAPFDSAAFSMAEGVISQPVKTSYGWHIIEVTGHRPLKSYDEMRETLTQQINSSPRGLIPRQRFIDKMMKKYDAHLIEKNLDEVETMVNNHPGGLTKEYNEELRTSSLPLAVVSGTPVTLGEALAAAKFTGELNGKNVRETLAQVAEKMMTDMTVDLVGKDIYATDDNYRNLVNEYSDGILLFNISQDKVWQKAATDREGLENYFRVHRDKYTWDGPRFKSVIIFTTADSIEAQVKDFVATLNAEDAEPVNIGKVLKNKFGKNVRAERVIAAKGENAITDYLAFGGQKPDSGNNTWKCYFAYKGQVIDTPQEADDVKAKVTTDYQNSLEEEWLKDLHKKYPVKVDKKVLKKVKELPRK